MPREPSRLRPAVVDAACWALAHHITSVSLRRVSATASRITSAQLAGIRRGIGIAVATA